MSEGIGSTGGVEDFLRLVAERVPRARVLELGHGHDRAGPRAGGGLLFLAEDHEELVVALAALLARVVEASLRPEGPGENAEDVEPAGVGVGHGLEDERGERGLRVGGTLDFRAAVGVGPLAGAEVGGRGEGGDHEVEQEIDADVARRRAAKHRREGALQGPLAQRRPELFLRKGFPLQVTLDEGVVRLGDVFDQGLPLAFDDLGHLRRDLRGFAFPVLAVDEGLAADQVDDPAEPRLGADGQLQDDGLGLEEAFRLLEGAPEIGALAVELVHENRARQFEIVQEIPADLGLHLDAVHGVDEHQGPVGRLQAGLRVRKEVLVARGVEQGHGVLFPGELVKPGRDARGPTDFLGLEIERGVALLDPP